MSMPLRETLLELAGKAGFESAVLDVKELVFAPEYRKFCEDNVCGNYGKNYSCPPVCGTPGEMEERTRPFERALVLRSTHRDVNALDPVLASSLKKEHNRKTRELVKEVIRQTGLSPYLAIAAGPCSLCATCLIQKGEPCLRPKERMSCLSAYCIDISKTAEKCGMKLSWDLTQISYFSMLLFVEGGERK